MLLRNVITITLRTYEAKLAAKRSTVLSKYCIPWDFMNWKVIGHRRRIKERRGSERGRKGTPFESMTGHATMCPGSLTEVFRGFLGRNVPVVLLQNYFLCALPLPPPLHLLPMALLYALLTSLTLYTSGAVVLSRILSLTLLAGRSAPLTCLRSSRWVVISSMIVCI